jgi:hypothetical protein
MSGLRPYRFKKYIFYEDIRANAPLLEKKGLVSPEIGLQKR